jgi:hypothetical protein
MKRLSIIAIVMASIAFGCHATAQNTTDAELVSRVLKAKRTSEIPPQSLSDIEKMNFIMGIPDRLFSYAVSAADKDTAWGAIHHFRTLADAGVSESFHIDCLGAMHKYPLIFYNRYMSGDDLALERMNDALTADWTNDDETDLKEEKINRTTISQEIIAIEAVKNLSPEKAQRQKKYLESLQQEFELRKKRFKEVFPNVKID